MDHQFITRPALLFALAGALTLAPASTHAQDLQPNKLSIDEARAFCTNAALEAIGQQAIAAKNQHLQWDVALKLLTQHKDCLTFLALGTRALVGTSHDNVDRALGLVVILHFGVAGQLPTNAVVQAAGRLHATLKEQNDLFDRRITERLRQGTDKIVTKYREAQSTTHQPRQAPPGGSLDPLASKANDLRVFIEWWRANRPKHEDRSASDRCGRLTRVATRSRKKHRDCLKMNTRNCANLAVQAERDDKEKGAACIPGAR